MQNFKVSNNLTEYLNQLDWNNKLAVATSLERVRNDRLLSKSVYCFDESNNIQTYPLKIFMRKGFNLQKKLDRFIEYTIENGVIVKWTRKNTFRSFVEERRIQMDYDEVKAEIFKFFVPVILGVSLGAFVIMVFEVIVHTKVHSHGSAKLWRYIQMMIDPERYFLLYDFAY